MAGGRDLVVPRPADHLVARSADIIRPPLALVVLAACRDGGGAHGLLRAHRCSAVAGVQPPALVLPPRDHP